jgi:hypothetical protein
VTEQPDFTVRDEGTIIMLRPNTDAARDWLDENVQSESWQWQGMFLCIDHRVAQPLIDGIEEEGFTGERM